MALAFTGASRRWNHVNIELESIPDPKIGGQARRLIRAYQTVKLNVNLFVKNLSRIDDA